MEVELNDYNQLIQNTFHLDTNVPFDELKDDIDTSVCHNSITTTSSCDVISKRNNFYEEILHHCYDNSSSVKLIAGVVRKRRRNERIDQIFADFDDGSKDTNDYDDDNVSTFNDVVSQDTNVIIMDPQQQNPYQTMFPNLHIPMSRIHPNHTKSGALKSGYYRVHKFDLLDEEEYGGCDDNDVAHHYEESFELEYMGQCYKEEEKDDPVPRLRCTDDGNGQQEVETKCSCVIS